MFDLVGEMRQLVTVLMQIEKDLKELIKAQKQKEEGGAKK